MLLWFALGLPMSPTLRAEAPAATAGEKILITADRLLGDSRSGQAEFSGNVEAVQGDFVINAERIKIFYRDIDQKTGPAPDAIHKIVAAGNVSIRSGNRLAETDRAEYSVSDGTLILIGENSTVTDGKNVITGARIRLNRADSRISVEGDDRQRVRAIIYPSEDPSFSEEQKGAEPSDK
jgi:lipopolysaccharide export system protein LptA